VVIPDQARIPELRKEYNMTKQLCPTCSYTIVERVTKRRASDIVVSPVPPMAGLAGVDAATQPKKNRKEGKIGNISW
jgi:hypothetical protein